MVKKIPAGMYVLVNDYPQIYDQNLGFYFWSSWSIIQLMKICMIRIQLLYLKNFLFVGRSRSSRHFSSLFGQKRNEITQVEITLSNTIWGWPFILETKANASNLKSSEVEVI